MAERVLVTGGAGFIGSHTVDALLSEGFDVRILDSLTPRIHPAGLPDYIPAEAEFVLGDVRDPDALRGALQDVDIVLHAAAYQDYRRDFATYTDVNTTSTALLYEIIVRERLGVRKILITSSQFVQGEGLYVDRRGRTHTPTFRSRAQLERGMWDHLDPHGVPMQWVPTGEDVAMPTNAYSLSKWGQEKTALVLGERYRIPTTVLRYSIVQGARQSFHNPYSGACRIFSLSYLAGKSPAIFEDGRQVRDFVNVADVVSANLLVIRNGDTDYRVFCVGGGTPVSILEFDRIVAAEFDRSDLEPNIPGIFRFGDTRNAVSDTAALRSLGWQPTRTVGDSVREYAEWLRSNNPEPAILESVAREMTDSGVVGRVQRGSRSTWW